MEQTSHPQASPPMRENYSSSISGGQAAGINNTNDHRNGLSGPHASSPAPATPSDATDDDSPLSASEYLWVDYRLGNDGCDGDTQFCPCGDGCTCLGCSVHNNSADPIHPPKTNANTNQNDEHSPSDDGSTVSKSNCCGGVDEVGMNGNGNAVGGLRSAGLDSSFGIMCVGDEGTCPCLPDQCACIGCTIHARSREEAMLSTA